MPHPTSSQPSRTSRAGRAAVTAMVALAAAGAASAQTVIVAGAPAQSAVELALNANVIATGTADEDGNATLPVNLAENRGRPETDVRVVVDTCSALHRVSLIEPPLQPPPLGEGCARRELTGLFIVREITTFVVYVGGVSPTVRVRQGRPPLAWLMSATGDRPRGRDWGRSPTGLVLSGAGGFSWFSDPHAAACGSVTSCSGPAWPITLGAGATYWVGRFLGAEAAYVRPGDLRAFGGGAGYRFDTLLETDVFTLSGKAGFPAGPARIYGQAGATYTLSTSTTTQTTSDQVIEVDGELQILPGGTQKFRLNTKGWGWLVGGGVEFWSATRFAVFFEFSQASLKGENSDGGEGFLDQPVRLFLGGARMKVF